MNTVFDCTILFVVEFLLYSQAIIFFVFYAKFQELFNIHNPNKLSQQHRNILVVNATYACPTLFFLPNPY